MSDTHVRADPVEWKVLDSLVESGQDGPVLMLNLNRYSALAGYPDGEEYLRYISTIERTIGKVGGRILWRTPNLGTLIGCAHDQINEILAIWYPKLSVFNGLGALEGSEEMWERRERCVIHAIIHRCPGDRYPLQPAENV